MKNRLLIIALLGAILFPFTMHTEAQTVVFDGEIYWEWPTADNDYGGYGFYWWHQTDNPNLGEMPTDDWLSPDNYFDGEFRMRFEVLEQPTDEPFKLQFGIWQDSYLGHDHLEQVCSRQEISKGTVFDASIGTPSDWWSLQGDDNKLDFSRPEDFYHIGLILWNPSPLCIPKDPSWGSDGCPEYKDDFFPMRARVTITAYTDGGIPKPDYTVDYNLERTIQQISTDDQWSPDNSTWYDGNGDYLDLTPGDTVYFRKRQDYSKTQTLVVKERPLAPEFTIDYTNERTADTVSSDHKYSTSSDMSEAVDGTGDFVDLTPGTDIYFQKWWTWTEFRSDIQALTVPGRPASPAYTIDYANEQTGEAVPTTDEYASDPGMSDVQAGTGATVPVTPGDTLYFRTRATASSFNSASSQLIAPGSPDTPSFTVDFSMERTAEVVEPIMEVSSSADMSGAVAGPGDYLDITPGSDLFFRQAATGSGFRSGVQSLDVPGRPASPSYTIDFINEATAEAVPAEVEYTTQEGMGDAVPGDGTPAQVIPGVTNYFRVMATASSFASEVFPLPAPGRPATTAYSIDYPGESTNEAIAVTDEYADNMEMTGATAGGGAILGLTPGTGLYFRTMATASSFTSEVQSLEVPARPADPAFSIDYSSETTAEAISSEYMYAASIDMLGAVTGNGVKVPVTPGSELHIRKKATGNDFASGIQSILMAARPASPEMAIDFQGETTSEVVPSTMEYSQNSLFDPSGAGTGQKVDIAPGSDLYLRMMATMNDFSSEIKELNAPLRPVISSDEGDTTELDPFVVSVIFFQPASNLSAAGITAMNGTVEGITLISAMETSTVYQATVSPMAGGTVLLQVLANAVDEGNFISQFFNINYKSGTGTLQVSGMQELTLYPNPTTGRIKVSSPLLGMPGTVLGIYSLTGKLVVTEQPAAHSREMELELGHLDRGVYILKLTSGSGSVTRKVVLQGHK